MKKRILNMIKKTMGYGLRLLGLTVALSVCFWSADYLLYWFGLYIAPYFHKDSFILAVLLALFLVQVKNSVLFYTTLGILLALSYAGFFHYFYFGRYFTGYDIALFFNETTDTALAFFEVFFTYWPLLIVVLGLIGLMIFVRLLSTRYLKRSNWAMLGVLVCLAIIPIQNIKRGGEFAFPNATQFMYFNALKSVSSYVVDVVAKSQEPKPFLPYEITLKNTNEEPITILYIMGEGLAGAHLSLFGYERDTTPKLKKWAERNDFYHTMGISGAVVTRNSIAGFMNFQKEPENYTLVQSKRYNLFKLAKEAGFKTTFMSPQTFSSFPHVGLEYTDYAFYRAQKGAKDIPGDEFWLENLKTLPMADKNFVVIQMRAVHAPYAKTWQHRFDEFNTFVGSADKRLDEYDNGVLYVDDILNQTLALAEKIPGKVYVFFASDHNELFGEYDLYGHITLHPFVARVPVFAWTNHKNGLADFKRVDNPSHWDIGRQILNLMGYAVSNPNTPDDVIFVQGSDPTGAGGFMTFKRVGKSVLDETGTLIR